MARMSLKGFEEYLAELQRIHGSSEELAKRALYTGAGVVTDAIKSSMSGIPTRDPKKFYKNTLAPGLTPQEKADVIRDFGLMHMKTEGSKIYTQAGFKNGYSSHKTKRYPGGIPTPLLARSVESGTSWMKKTPFVRKAANAARKPAIEAMRKQYDSDIERITG